MNDIEQKESQFIADYEEIGDWLLQFQMLIEIIADVEEVPTAERTDQNRIHTCQSAVWVDCFCKNGRIYMREYSEALIIRGVLAVYASLINGKSPEEVAAFEPRFVNDTTIRDQLNTDRQNGFGSIVKKVREFAAGQL